MQIFKFKDKWSKIDIQEDFVQPGVLQQTGLFETMRLVNGEFRFAELHWSRLEKGLRYFQQEAMLSKEVFFAGLEFASNSFNGSNASVRFSVLFDGDLEILITVKDFIPQQNDGLCVDIFPENFQPKQYSHLKTYDYSFYHRAYEWSIKNHLQEAILKTSNQSVIELSRANFYMIKDDRIITPPINDGCLAGTVRQLILEYCHRKNLKFSEETIKLVELSEASELFCTNAVCGIRSIVRIPSLEWESSNAAIAQKIQSELFQDY